VSALAQIRLENPTRRARKKKNVGELLIFGNPKKKGFGNHRVGCPCKFCDRAKKLQSGELKPPKLPNRKKRNSKKLDAQRGARERASRIRAARVNPDLVDAIRAGSKVTIVNRFGQQRTGRAVMRSSTGGWVLNMGGRHGTPGLADRDNVVRVKNPAFRDVLKRGSREVIIWKDNEGSFYHVQPYVNNGETIVKSLGKYAKLDTAREKANKWLDEGVRNPKRSGPRRRRGDRNPSETKQAVRLFQGFHGHDPKEIAEKHVSAAVRLDYTALGDLKYLAVETPLGKEATFTFDGDGVKLASSPDGKQLYCIGGDQNILPLLDERSREKDFIDMGDALEVAYLARKVHGDYRPIEYFHEFGEVNGAHPRLMFDKLRKNLFFIGGDYFIDVTMRAPGTPLGKVSPGIEN
jgi:hypothetical protein